MSFMYRVSSVVYPAANLVPYKVLLGLNLVKTPANVRSLCCYCPETLMQVLASVAVYYLAGKKVTSGLFLMKGTSFWVRACKVSVTTRGKTSGDN